jgi:hypothetical protein
MQRTRQLASPPHSPLTRRPLGDLSRFEHRVRMPRLPHVGAFWLVASCACIALACQSSPSQPRRGSSVSSAIELDHVYLYAPAQSTEVAVVAALTQHGLRVSDQRRKFSDGVVGRYVRFDNAYLEVLWHDGVTSADATTRRQAQWETTGASPIGIGLRRVKGAPEELPFPTRRYSASWMQPGSEMRLLGAEADRRAPALFVVPEGQPDTATLEQRLVVAPSEGLRRRLNDRVHPLGIRYVTGVRAVVHPSGVSEAVRMLSESGIVQIDSGSAPLLELRFDDIKRGESGDLRPILPLVLNY